MASALQSLSDYQTDQMPDASDMRIGIVVAEWNQKITHALYEGCLQTLTLHGTKKDHIQVAQVPGSFELPIGARLLMASHKLDAVICIGCVIKGETAHDEYINHAVATAIAQLSLTSGKPIIFGVLTPNNWQQAKDRSGGRYGNKGVEAAQTAIRMVALAKALSSDGGGGSIGFFDK